MVNFSKVSSTGAIGKLLRLPLRLIPPEMSVPILQGPMRGKKWIVGSADHGCWLGSYEWEKQQEVQRFLKLGSVFYDIGANVGIYTLLAAQLVGHSGSVYAFEPMPRNLDFLHRHVAMNKLSNVTIFEQAVSNVQGTIRFSPGASHSMAKMDEQGKVEVSVTSLDAAVANHGLRPPHMIKIDVEGAEVSVLEGAAHLLAANSPIIFLATHGEKIHSDCLKLLYSMNFHVEALSSYQNELRAQKV